MGTRESNWRNLGPDKDPQNIQFPLRCLTPRVCQSKLAKGHISGFSLEFRTQIHCLQTEIWFGHLLIVKKFPWVARKGSDEQKHLRIWPWREIIGWWLIKFEFLCGENVGDSKSCLRDNFTINRMGSSNQLASWRHLNAWMSVLTIMCFQCVPASAVCLAFLRSHTFIKQKTYANTCHVLCFHVYTRRH